MSLAHRLLRTTRQPGAAAAALHAVLCLIDASEQLDESAAAEAAPAVATPAERGADGASAKLDASAAERSSCATAWALGDPTASELFWLTHQLLSGTSSRATLSRQFARRHYALWASFLLTQVLRDWHGALTQRERTRLFDAQFLKAPPMDAFCAIAAVLRPDSNPAALPTAAATAEPAAEPPAESAIGASIGGGDGAGGGIEVRRRVAVCALLIDKLVEARALERLFVALARETDGKASLAQVLHR